MEKKTRGALNHQQLKYPTQVKNREFLNCISLFFQLCKNGHFVFPLGASLDLDCPGKIQSIGCIGFFYVNCEAERGREMDKEREIERDREKGGKKNTGPTQ